MFEKKNIEEEQLDLWKTFWTFRIILIYKMVDKSSSDGKYLSDLKSTNIESILKVVVKKKVL